MKPYTKTGDQGSAQLPTGPRLSKGDVRFEALGSLDELNSLLGWCRGEPGASDPLRLDLAWVQDRLMTVTAQVAVLAGDEPAAKPPVQIEQPDVTRLEASIDRTSQQMPMPRSFVVPGGCEAACRLHLARTACRRAERNVARCLDEVGAAQPVVRAFLNRLSDALFVWALHANHQVGAPNRPWQPR